MFDPARQRFEVRHPPVEATGLELEDVLGYLRRQAADLRLWLDLKDVDR